ncbi:MAG: replication protein RepB [Rhodococcus sp. (in: high G+C Gram-positive bacteria)]|uniref:replication protein RepB n=1 Tax=Rhodococcus sp. TaxID=1831 RepID=UPI003BB760BD
MAAQPDRRKRRMTAREAAERFGVSPRTIRYVVAEERTEYVGRAVSRRDQIIALHRQGLKQKAIAAQLDVTPALVSIRLREAREAGIDLSRLPTAADEVS